jgi:hypothetical protein
MSSPARVIRYVAAGLLLLSLGGCQPNVYANVGISPFGGYNSRVHTNISIGGRICC